ncbi:hypothetical protein Poly30_26370 [Planctomycetes bacterium Poly30]|uniref:General secretion pathway GspH domain-containing protein n=2 Tax=Saltatorellus ferox TaxID=2528018 RepID=A0A518ESP9_9BACT|nr:hypothetical protein Poly30_26370 [Planctomycetes bacterium Poly30]
MTVFLLITVNVNLVVGAGRSAATAGAFMMSIDDELHLAIDRVSLALMAADSKEVDGTRIAPLSSESVRFQTALGMNDGNVVHGPLEDVRWRPTANDEGEIQWRENPGDALERAVIWSKHVPIAFEAEIPNNGTDDNHNNLDDEGGLAFTMLGRTISIHLTVAREDENGRELSRNKRSVITCRN